MGSVWERAQKLTSWSGGIAGLLAILAAQFVLAGVFAFQPEGALAIILGFVGVVVILDKPILGVGVLLIARLVSTGATVFFRIGRMGIGPMEPTLVVCLAALVFHAALSKRVLWQSWPWRTPYLMFLGWVSLSLLWSVDPGSGLGEILPMLLVLANCLVILGFVTTWDNFRLMLWFWVGSCVAIGVLALASDSLGISVGDVSFQAAAGGGRETGLGQQPNWFAMNLMFIIHTCFGMALLERRKWLRYALIASGFFIFVMMLKSGSRGGAYATLIGGVLAALAHPLFRKWFVRFAVLTAVIFALGIAFNIGDAGQALTRIGSSVTLHSNIRQLNWLVCMEMFSDTFGLGIGVSGYEVLLPEYNNYIAQSLYDYPHGIFWEVIAHFGIIGLLLVCWTVVMIGRMVQELVAMSKGTEAEVFAWTMPAAMLGYAAWSFMEFTVNEKPFWEFLSLYTALYLIVKRMKEQGETLPTWSSPIALFGGTADEEPEAADGA
ncbi:MAG: O-antigen ligase family protein [Myxococcota bacterium]|nr:O-antigen ligase family protein [Myxococcota bacterium]